MVDIHYSIAKDGYDRHKTTILCAASKVVAKTVGFS